MSYIHTTEDLVYISEKNIQKSLYKVRTLLLTQVYIPDVASPLPSPWATVKSVVESLHCKIQKINHQRSCYSFFSLRRHSPYRPANAHPLFSYNISAFGSLRLLLEITTPDSEESSLTIREWPPFGYNSAGKSVPVFPGRECRSYRWVC